MSRFVHILMLASLITTLVCCIVFIFVVCAVSSKQSRSVSSGVELSYDVDELDAFSPEIQELLRQVINTEGRE